MPFTRIAQLRAEGHGFRQAVERTGCCTGCGLCEPYVRLVLQTGLTVLPILSAAEIARVQSGCAGEPMPHPRAWKD